MSAGRQRQLPGHVRGALRSIERFLPVVDLLLELVDARMPLASRLPGLTARLARPSLLVLGKSDLADPAVTTAWLQWFAQQGTDAVTLALPEPGSARELLAAVRARVRRTRRQGGRLMVIGIPNVGKSSLINALAGRRAARVANLPGVTRNIQWIKLEGDLELLDLPGVLDFARLRHGRVLRLINALPGRDQDPADTAGDLLRLLRRRELAAMLPGWTEVCKTHISVSDSYMQEAYIDDYGRRFGLLRAGGEVDRHRAVVDLLKRCQRGDFGRVSFERPDHPLDHRVVDDEPDRGEPTEVIG